MCGSGSVDNVFGYETRLPVVETFCTFPTNLRMRVSVPSLLYWYPSRVYFCCQQFDIADIGSVGRFSLFNWVDPGTRH